MKTELIAYESDGRKLLKIRLRTPPAKIFRDAKKYRRKSKYICDWS